MKKILLILFLFPCITFGQVTVSVINQEFNTSGLISTSGETYVAGRLYIIFFGISNDAATPGTISITGTGQTWDELFAVGGVANGGNRKRIQAFRFAPTTNNTNQTDYTYTGSQDGSFVILVEIIGADVTGTNGSNSIVQNGGGSANSADPSVTLSTIANASTVLAAFINGVNPFTGTEEGGWTEAIDGGYATPNTGGYLMYRINTTDNTPTVTAASGNWAGLALVIKSARRIIITN